MITRLGGLMCAMLLGVVAPADDVSAQGFPTGRVTLIVPTSPGAMVDIAARLLQPHLARQLGQPVIVDNRVGATTQIGTAYVAKEPANGHTLLVGLDQFVTNAVADKKLPYDIFRDFVPVSFIVRSPFVISASPSVNASNLREFIEMAKRMPGKLNYGSTGNTTGTFLVTAELNLRAGIDALHVPYSKGAAPMIRALMSNDVQYASVSFASVRSLVQAGKIKALAVAGANRVAELSGVPTVAESGLPGFEAYNWVGIFARAGTAEAIVSRLHAEFAAAVADEGVRSRLLGAGLEIPDPMSSQEFGRFVKSEYDRWDRFLRESNVKLQ